MLIFGCYSYYYNDDITIKAIEVRIVLVLFTDNYNNIVQILSVALFNTFKKKMKKEIDNHIIETSSPPLTKIEYFEPSFKART